MRHARLREAPAAAAACLLAAACVLSDPTTGVAQILRGPWVDRAEAQARETRMRDVRVIVLDAEGGVVADASVELEQLALRFFVGVSGDVNRDVLVERARDTGLPVSTAAVAPWDDAHALALLSRAADRDTQLVGPVISDDLADWPESLATLDGEPLFGALLERLDAYATVPGRLLPLGDVLNPRDAVHGRLGDAARRLIMQRLDAARPTSTLGVLAADALIGQRQAAMLRAVVALREAFVPFGFVAVSYRGSVPPPASRLAIELDRLARVDAPLVVCDLQAGGPTPIDAATHAETLLRLLFAQPNVEGVYFAALDPADATEPHAALLDDAGRPSAVGRVVARLFGEHYLSGGRFTSDVAGNAYARLYHGTHRATVTLPDGTTTETRFRLDPGDTPHIVVVQPIQR